MYLNRSIRFGKSYRKAPSERNRGIKAWLFLPSAA